MARHGRRCCRPRGAGTLDAVGSRLLLLALWPLWLTAAPERAGRPPSCPAGFDERPSRARNHARRLAADDEARALPGTADFALCFRAGAEAGITSGAILLPDEMPDERAAARVAHLLHHRVPRSPLLETPTTDCAAWVERVRQEEEAAHALEARMLARAGLDEERSFDGERLAAAYAARCDAQARAAAR